MDISTAYANIREYYSIPCPTEDDEFVHVESLKFLIEETKDPLFIFNLGEYYYEKRKFDLALKYYEMAAEMGLPEAEECLGYIWYYGRTGEKDYKKAFKYFEKGMKRGDMISAYKVADMYKNGYCVEKDHDKYKEIIEELYERIQTISDEYKPIPEVYTRLAKIRADEGDTKEAVRLYKEAKFYLASRLTRSSFFGNINIMNWLICDLYKLVEPEYDNLDLYDLYYILTEPHEITFRYNRETYTVSSVMENDECVINFGDSWFKTPADFMSKAKIDGVPITTLYDELYMFECE